MPCDYKKYPANWKALRQQKLADAKHCCQGSPKFPDCSAKNYKPHPVSGSRVVLALCHLDRDINNNEDDNLKIWCQRCHIHHDLPQHIYNRKYGEYNNALQKQIKFTEDEPFKQAI